MDVCSGSTYRNLPSSGQVDHVRYSPLLSPSAFLCELPLYFSVISVYPPSIFLCKISL